MPSVAVPHSSRSAALPSISLPSTRPSERKDARGETHASRMISRMLCLAVAILSIPGVVLGLVCMAAWRSWRATAGLVARLGGRRPAPPSEEAEIEFPAMWR